MRKATTVYNAEKFKDSDIIEIIISGMSPVKYKPHSKVAWLYARLPLCLQLILVNVFKEAHEEYFPINIEFIDIIQDMKPLIW